MRGFNTEVFEFLAVSERSSIASRISVFADSRPPTFSHFTCETSSITSRMALGPTSLWALLKSLASTFNESSTSCGISSASRSRFGRYRRNARIPASSRASAKVRTDKPMGLLGKNVQADIFGKRHPPGVDLQDLDPVRFSRHTDLDFAVKPAGRRAASMASTRLVAPITTTCPRSSRPSIIVRSWATTRRSTSPVTSSRRGAIESSSSIKIIDGAFSRASSKTSRRRCSLSP